MQKFAILSFAALLAASAAGQNHAPVVHPSAQPRLSTVAMIDLPGRPGFDAIAFADNLIVISHTQANSIDVFDPQRRRMVAQITNVAQPRGIAVDAKNKRFYVATAKSVIDVISSEDWQVKDSFNVQGSPDVLALSDDGLRLYVGDQIAGTVSAVDTSLRKEIAKAQMPGRPEAIALGGSGIFVSVEDAALIAVLDPQLQVTGQFKLQASQPTALVYDAAAHRLYVAVRAAVLAINPDNGAEVGRAPAPRGVESLALDSASHTLFSAGGGAVASFNTASGLTALDELPADVKGHNLVYDASRRMLFLPGGREGRSKMLIMKDLSGAPSQEPAEAKLQ